MPVQVQLSPELEKKRPQISTEEHIYYAVIALYLKKKKKRKKCDKYIYI